MGKPLNLKNDVLFKEFFSREGNEKYLIDFLSGLLERKIHKIEIQRDVSLERLSAEEKLGILDIQATLDDNTIVSIEMQMRDQKDMIRRSSFYAAKGVSSDLKRGESYKTFKTMIMVNILNFKITPYEEYITKGITVLEEHREHNIDTGIYYYYIELPKFRKAKPDMGRKINQWLAFIDNEEGGLVEMAKEKNEVIKEAEKELHYLTGDDEVRRMEFLHEKWEHDYASGVENARDEGIEEGKKQGKEEGIKQGIEEGMKQGLQEGEEKNNKEVAKKMKDKNLPIEMITEITGLSKEEIETL